MSTRKGRLIRNSCERERDGTRVHYPPLFCHGQSTRPLFTSITAKIVSNCQTGIFARPSLYSSINGKTEIVSDTRKGIRAGGELDRACGGRADVIGHTTSIVLFLLLEERVRQPAYRYKYFTHPHCIL
ncbi:hypothetical protein EVAR_68106_1 [Eumeta japonica]|uniref:Uncharacterized protein n=1 Tax=Eumeta variegata TaxID=151549 RepID=A0A4C1ZF92_EUMVA|nr:hypothetical protein EVAR_68106_1 [Eumeta japonica]